MKITKCLLCYMGESNCIKQKLPRKKKKDLKNTVSFFRKYDKEYGYNSWINSCTIYDDYKRLIPMINNYKKVKKYEPIIKFLSFISDDYIDFTLSFTIDGKLGYYWDDDNGLYCYDGIGAFEFNDNNTGTWFYSQTKEICELFNINIDQINNEQQFLKQANRNLNIAKSKIFNNEY